MLKEVPTRNRVAGVLPADLRDVSCEVMMIGPHNVDFFLSMNTRNYRSIKTGRVKRFAADMNADRWTLVTDAIGVTKSEVLTNGQHRLEAIKATGCTVPMLVIWNLPDGAEKDANTDSQQPRGADTHLHACGVSNAASVAAVTRMLYRVFSGKGDPVALTNSTILELSRRMPCIVDAVAASHTAFKIVRASVAGAWYCIAYHDDPEAAIECFEIFTRKKDASAFHPMNTVREYLNAKDTTKGRNVNTQFAALSAMLYAYQLALSGREIKLLRVPDSAKLPSSSMELSKQFMDIVVNIQE